MVKLSAKLIAAVLQSQKWIPAKTQPHNPHEYCLRENWSAEASFDDVVVYIRQNGFEQRFDDYPYTYFYIDGYQYWTMGSPVCDTILLNKARLKCLDIYVAGPFGWPRFEAGLPPLPPVRGVYLQTVDYQDGFLPYSVGITTRPVRKRFNEHRLKFVSGCYNVLDVTYANRGIKKIVWKGWGWTPEKRAEFDARRSEIADLSEQQLRATRIFTMDLGSSQRLLERLEGTIAKRFCLRDNTLFDQGMFLAPRWKTEDPIVASFRCGSLLHGLRSPLEI
jgi:hypothetical protein